MIRVRPVLVLPVLVAALLLPGAAEARSNFDVTDPVDSVLKHGDLVGAVVTYRSTGTERGETTELVTTDHYDSRGRRVLRTVVGTDSSGAVISRREVTSEYSAKGGLAFERDVSDFDGDGPSSPAVIVTTATFDQQGYVLTQTVAGDFDGDGSLDLNDTYAFGNDHQGRAVTTLVQRDYNGDGVADSLVREVTTYDARGRVLRDTGTSSSPEGEAQGSGETVNAYDQHGQLTSTSQSTYAADGSLLSRDGVDTTFDVHGNAMTLSETFDEDGTPGTDYRSVVTNTYDGHQRLVDSTQRGFLGDGTPAGIYATRYTYDGPGDFTSQEVLADYDGDGVLESQGRLDVTYDRQGRPVLFVGTSSEGSSRDVFRYDNQGRRTSRVSTYYDASGTLTSRSTGHYDYPSKSSYVITWESDYDADGVVDATWVVTRQVT